MSEISGCSHDAFKACQACVAAFKSGPRRASKILDHINSTRAQRWSLFYAAALQGLLAAPAEMRSESDGDQNALAAEYADDALLLHDERFPVKR